MFWVNNISRNKILENDPNLIKIENPTFYIGKTEYGKPVVYLGVDNFSYEAFFPDTQWKMPSEQLIEEAEKNQAAEWMDKKSDELFTAFFTDDLLDSLDSKDV